MKCALPHGHNAKGECLKSLMGGYMCTSHNSQDTDGEGLDGHEELSQREEQETEEKECLV